MEREYIKIKKPSPLPSTIHLLKNLDDEFWKNWVFFHLLSFYKNFDRKILEEKINTERAKFSPRIEREIAKFLRLYLKNNRQFDLHFDVFGEITNDEDIEGNYDILINNTYWKNGFFFECKNLNENQDLINKYVSYNKGGRVYDGGVYRYFNGKYAQNQNFGGMIGFILDGDNIIIKNKIHKKLKEKFDITSQGDLLSIEDSSIEKNEFTFDSIHKRFETTFLIHHILFELTS